MRCQDTQNLRTLLNLPREERQQVLARQEVQCRTGDKNAPSSLFSPFFSALLLPVAAMEELTFDFEQSLDQQRAAAPAAAQVRGLISCGLRLGS